MLSRHLVDQIISLQDEEERQQQLRERARKLIAEARQGLVSPTMAVVSGAADNATNNHAVSISPARRNSSHSHSPSPTESTHGSSTSSSTSMRSGAGRKLQSFDMLIDKEPESGSRKSIALPSLKFVRSLSADGTDGPCLFD